MDMNRFHTGEIIRKIGLFFKKFRVVLAKVKNETNYLQNRHYVRSHKIIIQLRNQLGNHMFIYVLFLQLKSAGKDVTIDNDTNMRIGQPFYNKFLLSNAFSIYVPEADQDDIDALLDSGIHKTDKLRRKLFGKHPKKLQEFDDFAFDKRFLAAKSGYFTGWYQNTQYFNGIEDKIRESFQFRAIPLKNRKALEMEKEIKNNVYSVSIHLRFGDYLDKYNKPNFENFSTKAYYRSAILKICDSFPCTDFTFFIFSDDSLMAAEFIGNVIPDIDKEIKTVVVNVCSKEYSWIDMYLMSLCHHNIIANSTFSWWGAWLNTHPDKIVISPSLWYRREGKTYSAIWMENAIQIDPDGNIVQLSKPAG